MNTAPVKIAVAGLGNMGVAHCRWILDGRVPGLELAAVCDISSERARQFSGIPGFVDFAELLESRVAEAVLIATPHYSHTTLGIAALRAGLHVLVEKPISVHKADCERLIGAHTGRRQLFAAMFNQRTDPLYRKVREIVHSGELGAVRRVNWTITDWFRTEAYYASSDWRATWAGEGGGVLLNQCPHNLDLLQWIFGMPRSVRGFCQLGRYHRIEVEDDVTAYFEYADGATAVFVASTGEAPGTNRLEIAGERGRVTSENGRIEYLRNETPASEFSRTSPELFGRPPIWKVEIPLPDHRGEQHVGILKNFAAAIRGREPLIAPAAEGIHSVELANAILLSSLEGRTVELPLSATTFKKKLEALIASSRPRRRRAVRRADAQDFAQSFR